MMMRLDASSLSSLFASHGPELLIYAARRTYNAELALDVVGETFAVAFEKRTRFRGSTEQEAVGWLYSICKTVIHHHFRRSDAERRALARLGVEVPPIGDDERHRIEELAGLTALHQRVGEALDGLPLDQREAVRLRIIQDLRYPVIAARLGVSETAVRARVSRGLRSLARDLRPLKETA